VAFDGGLGEVGDVGVGDGDGLPDLRGEVTEAGAEDDGQFGADCAVGTYVADGRGGVSEEVDCWRFRHGSQYPLPVQILRKIFHQNNLSPDLNFKVPDFTGLVSARYSKQRLSLKASLLPKATLSGVSDCLLIV
jgi:hypothetical protein